MQTFALFVTKSPFDARNAESALIFCEAAVSLGHQIQHVFFYQSGIHNASELLEVNSDEVNMKLKWQQFQQANNVPLYVCITAATRRGLQGNSNISDASSCNLNASFEIVGMSEYFAALHDVNIKSIQF
jgi:tRNA 2-thiouridine synthesizing protein D